MRWAGTPPPRSSAPAAWSIRLPAGAATRSASVPCGPSDSSASFGSSSSGPTHAGSLTTPCTTTSRPSGSLPPHRSPGSSAAAPAPGRCRGPRRRRGGSATRRGPRRRSSLRASGSGRSPTSTTARGSSASKERMWTARMAQEPTARRVGHHTMSTAYERSCGSAEMIATRSISDWAASTRSKGSR